MKERITEPCQAHSTDNVTCVDLLYPPLPVAARFDVNEDRTINEISEDGAETALEKVCLVLTVMPRIAHEILVFFLFFSQFPWIRI